MGTATDELKLDIAIKATGIDIDIIKKTTRYSTYICQLPFFQEQKYLPRIFAVKILEYQISKMKEDMASILYTHRTHTWRN
jgi:hypothetical protein